MGCVANYTEATSMYAGRVDKHLGRKLRSGVWMTYDAVRDCYVCNEVMSNWADGKRLPKDKWHVSPYVEIYRDRIIFLREVHNSKLDVFGVQTLRASSNKIEGRRWQKLARTRIQSSYGHWRYQYTPDHEVVGNTPVILRNGKLELTSAPKERAIDNEACKAFNRAIIKARNQLKVRLKLGAFGNLTVADLNSHATVRGYGNKYTVYNDPKKFIQLLEAITEDDIQSFYPAIWVSLRSYWMYNNPQDLVSKIDVLHLFNRAVDSMREKMKRELGVVKYVEVANPDLSTDG